MNFLEKLDFLMGKEGINRNKLSQISGVPYTTIDGFYKKGYENTKISTIRKIASAFNVSLDYLIDDNISDERYQPPKIKKAPSELSEEALSIAKKYNSLDERGRGAVKAILSYEGEAAKPKPVDEKPKIIRLPKGMHRRGPMTEVDVYDEPAAAGLGNYVDEASPHHMEQYPSELVPSRTDFGVLISGNSMEPKIPDGSTVFVQAAPALDGGEIGIFVLDGQTYCKQLKIDHDSQRTVLHSINPDYDDIEIPPWAEFRALGRVLDWFTPRKFD